MILDETYSTSRIEEIQNALRAPRDLLLRAIYAFHLLERLSKSGIDFVFKGGTSLLMMMDEPKRFSTDVDIVVGKDLEERWPELLRSLVKGSRFKEFADDNARSVALPGIQHYTRLFDDPDTAKAVREYPLVLDILHVDDLTQYRTQHRPLRHSWILTDEENPLIKVPTYEWMLGDKLSTFAPRTTGVHPLPKAQTNKEQTRDTSHLQSAKHLHDCGHLAMLARDLREVDDSLQYHIDQQAKLRKQRFTREEVLHDIAQAAIDLILDRENDVVHAIRRGTRSMEHHLIAHGEKQRYQQRLAAITVALAHRLLENDLTPLPVYDRDSIRTELPKSIRSLRRINPEACFYLQDVIKE